MNNLWFEKYFNRYKKSIFDKSVIKNLLKLKSMLETIHSKEKKVMFMGNGASASIANHISVDLTKIAGIRAINFNEANLITCLSNDFGYENWMAKAIEMYQDQGDVVILISSSGKSPNVINAAKYARKLKLEVVTFSGFDFNNPLKENGDLNFWVDSKAYNIIENTHQIWLLAVCDSIVGNAEYSAN